MENKPTILVVDDEKTNLDFVVNNLENDYKLKTAPNGKVALKILEKFKIDLILLDVQMPVLDGYETAKAIKENQNLKDIPFIFLTSKNDSDSIIYGFELGARDYISKPFNIKELQVRVKNHIQTFQLIQKLESSYKNLEKFIDTQDNIVFLTDAKEIQFANKKFFEYLGYIDLEDFKNHQKCICESFIENERFFHLGKVKEGENWTDHIKALPHSKRVVSILGKDFKPHAFSISINDYDENLYIISFADISQTIRDNISLENKVIHDKLTGAFNREYFEQNYQSLLNEYRSTGHLLGLALLDIDHFKSVNDIYGHDVGDEVLKYFVSTVHRYSRNEDIFIRWGGEEFILIVKVLTEAGLSKVLEHLRKVIEIQKFPTVGQKTCSIGGTLYQEGEDIEQTIKRADEAVYDAKAAGRNRVVVV